MLNPLEPHDDKDEVGIARWNAFLEARPGTVTDLIFFFNSLDPKLFRETLDFYITRMSPAQIDRPDDGSFSWTFWNAIMLVLLSRLPK